VPVRLVSPIQPVGVSVLAIMEAIVIFFMLVGGLVLIGLTVFLADLG